MKYNLNDYFDKSDDFPRPKKIGPLPNFDSYQFNLWLKMKGKTPNIIAKKMAEEFFRQFPKSRKVLENKKATETYIFFLAAGNNTWNQLDYGIKLVARLFNPDTTCIAYWDKMRHLAKACQGDSSSAQRRQVYRKEMQGVSFEEARPIIQIEHCHLCWRGVPRRKGTKSNVYCPTHSFLETSEYRRRKRIRNKNLGQDKKIRIIYSDTFQSISSFFAPYKKLPTFRTIRDMDGTTRNIATHITWDEIWYSQPSEIISKMPYVSKFLAKKKIDTSSPVAIVTALEQTHNTNIREDELKALEKFYYDSSIWFDAYYEHLILAELWLKFEATTKHGGKRSGAGRPHK